MRQNQPLFPARLHHLCLSVREHERSLAFYRDALGLAPAPLPGTNAWVLSGGQRTLILEAGPPAQLRYAAYAVADERQLDALRERLRRNDITPEASPSPLLREGAFAARDPDGGLVAFGLPRAVPGPADRLPGRLQHVVKRSAQIEAVTAFYRDGLGFELSDTVLEGPRQQRAAFLRSDHEHHSFAVFHATEPAFDHFSLEANSWNDLRDWADHFAGLATPLFWGPGRHGPGNNLFLMVRDPEGNAVEVSAEIETITDGRAPGVWQHNERTLNLWGGSWTRS